MWYWLLLNTCKLEFCILWTIGKLWQNAIPIGYNSRSFTGMGEAGGRFGHTIGRPLTIRITEFFTVRLSVAIRILTAKIIRPSLQKKSIWQNAFHFVTNYLMGTTNDPFLGLFLVHVNEISCRKFGSERSNTPHCFIDY